MITEQCFDTGLVTLNYAETNIAGPPLVLLHGGSARWQSALPIMPELSRSWHVYAPDLRGHGKSGRVPGGYQLKDYEGDMVAFLREVVRQPAVLFGHSLGGFVAMLVAAHYPHLVRGLIIGDAPFDRDKLRYKILRDRGQLLHWRTVAASGRSLAEMAEVLKGTPIVVEGEPEPITASALLGDENPWFHDMAEHLQHNDPDMLTAVIEFDEMFEGFDYQRLFARITCPTLIIQGSPAHRGALSDEEVEQAVMLLPCVTVARMEGVGHPLHTQEKEPVLRAMEAFLDTL